jgi:hypothetical protein
VLDCTVKVLPPSTISGCVNNSFVVFAVNCADLIAVILLFVTVTVGVPADVTSIDLMTTVSLIAGILAPKGVRAAPLVILSIP